MFQKNFKLFSLFGGLLLVLLLSACTSRVEREISERVMENASNGQVQVDIKNDGVKVETEAGSGETGTDLSLPADFPEDVYVITGKIKTVYRDAGKNGYTASIETDKTVAEAKELYDQELKQAGWKIDSFMDLGGSMIIGASKEKRSISVMINQDAETGKTTVLVGTSENID